MALLAAPVWSGSDSPEMMIISISNIRASYTQGKACSETPSGGNHAVGGEGDPNTEPQKKVI